MKLMAIAGMLLGLNATWAADGPISGGGGGAVTYQAIAISQILSDISSNMEIAQKYFPISGAGLRAIEFVKSERNPQYPHGHSTYLVRNSGDCSVEVETIATSESGQTYTTIWHELSCPGNGSACTGWGGENPPSECGGRKN